ncbi:26S proteasome non-ATPase regulatory subunit 9-like isoform X2 [Littorina saxatilis]|uniref:26S proteasome non-ATPase regulatory subunit 9 n=1 Tax=Littorina saxatilis TaxID=31220 RepID=A0AAN9BKF4_9CAEN
MAASEQMKTLMKQRDDIQKEIEELTDVLQSQKGVGLDGPLVDSDGYPRNDIDVYSVRHARHRIACLQTDYSAVMKDIETELYRIHAELRESREDESHDIPMEVTGSAPTSPQAPPFVTVDRVDPSSPAADAGLQVGDEIVEFGSVTSHNFTGLKQIGELVHHSVGRPVRVAVLRQEKSVLICLTPGPWSGRGNLGCNIVAIKR